ncbi:MAG: zinc-dependent alcohol dehydrogenase family protein [Alphaproteobacteria bacterium]
MKAVRLHRTGGPDVLQLDEVPTPAPGEVLVRAHSIGVGIADQLVRDGRYPWMPPLPTIPGIEMSGTVAATGAGVTRYREGDPVIVSAVPERSCYAEYVAIDADWAFPVRDGIDLADAGCLMNYRVAWRILHTAARVRAGETVAIVGAAGGVGSALLQLAKAAGLTVVALVRSPEKVAFAATEGADHVIDTRREDLAERIAAITDGRGVDLFVDPVGGTGFAGHLDLLAPVGMLVLYGLIEGWPPDTTFGDMCRRMARSPAVRLFSIHAYDDRPDATGEDLDRLMGMIGDGAIKPAIGAAYPLAMAADAHRLLDGGTATGKILLQPGRTVPLTSIS